MYFYSTHIILKLTTDLKCNLRLEKQRTIYVMICSIDGCVEYLLPLKFNKAQYFNFKKTPIPPNSVVLTKRIFRLTLCTLFIIDYAGLTFISK